MPPCQCRARARRSDTRRPGPAATHRVGCGLSRQWRLSAVRRRVDGRLRRTHPGRPVGRTTTATAGCRLSRQWRFSAVRRHAAGRLRRTYSGRRPSGPHDYRDCRPGGGSMRPVRRRSRPAVCRRPGRAAVTTVVRAGARCALFAGGVTLPSAGGRAVRLLRLPSGRGPAHPVRRSSHLSV